MNVDDNTIRLRVHPIVDERIGTDALMAIADQLDLTLETESS